MDRPWKKVRPRKKDFTPEQIRRRRQLAADRMIFPRGPPIEFTTVYFKPLNTKPILAAHPWERNGIIHHQLKQWSIGCQVSGVTIIPSPIIALLCPKLAAPQVRQKLIDEGMTIPKNVDPIATHPKSKMPKAQADNITAKRLAALCLQSKSRNFHETVLEGIPESLRELVLEAYRTFTKDPEAKLGHRDRPYSLIIQMEEDQ